MEDPLNPSEDTSADFSLGPFDYGDDLSPIEPSNSNQDSTQPSTMNLPHKANLKAGLEALETIDITPDTKVTTYRLSPEPAAVEDDVALEPEEMVHHVGVMDSHPFPARRASYDYSGIKASRYAVQNNANGGDVYNFIHHETIAPVHLGYTYRGFNFDMGISNGNERQLSAFESAYESRAIYASRKRPAVSLEHGSAS
jgi:hypothetical protein